MNGERAKKRRKELRMSAESIAKALNTTRVTISRWESGVSEPDDKKKVALARLLGTSVAYLMGETDNPMPLLDVSDTVVITTNDASRKIISEPGRLKFNNGDISIDMPYTSENKRWFDEFITKVIMQAPVSREPALA